MRKFCSACVFIFLVRFSYIEIMYSVLNHSIKNTVIIQWKYFQRLFTNFTNWFFIVVRTKILSGSFQKFRFVLNSTPIMIKHKILMYHFFHISEVTLIKTSLKEDT